MISVRVATSESDYQKALTIRRQVFIEEMCVPKDLEVDEFEKDATYFLAALDDQDVATGRFRLTEEGVKFERIATLKCLRGRGVGQKLMAAMCAFAASHHRGRKCYMHAQLTAKSFYDKIGWHPVGKTFFEAGIEHVKMTL
jgi:predicted GNAT family N-acyltransferase